MANNNSSNNEKRWILANQYIPIESLLREKVLPDHANAGLVFDRYLPVWDGPAESSPQPKEGQSALRDFVKGFNNVTSEKRQRLKALQHRQQQLAERFGRMNGAWETEVTNTSRLVVGMGADHPLKNSFTFHPLYGVPFLPSSALKGLIGATGKLFEVPWLNEVLGKDDDAISPSQMGLITVLDAFPIVWPELAVDIINSHHPHYYRNARTAQPVETESPVPVFFLTVEAGARWRIRLLSRKGAQARLEQAGALLRDGFQWLGIGGKTAVGYGRMEQ